MNKHFKSFLFSIVVHSLLLAAVFFVYTKASTYMIEKKPKEQRICIQLASIQKTAAPTNELKKKEILKKKQKKVEKNPKNIVKKKIPKRRVKKKIKHKKIKKSLKKEPIKKTAVVKSVNKKPDKLQKLPIKKIEDTANQKLCTSECSMSKKVICKCDSKSLKKKKPQLRSAYTTYIDQHLSKIVELLQENLYYPRRARKRGIEGKVTVRFTLEKNAEVKNIKIITADKDILARGAVRTLENLSGEFPKPDEKLILTVPINYYLSR